MSVSYQLERWATYRRDCGALWAEQYADHGPDKDRMAMAPDVLAYEAMEAAGVLQILTARSEDRRMVGYLLTIIRQHLHHTNVLCAFEDVFFLGKAHRRGSTGIRLIREAIRHLQAAGVQKVYFNSDLSQDLSRLFGRLGFVECNIVYSRWIGS